MDRLLIVALLLAFASPAMAKDQPTYYTPQRIAMARENVENYEWARQIYSRILKGDGLRHDINTAYAGADRLVERDDDFIWMLQPTTKIGRFVPNRYKALCPVHGLELRARDPWSGFNIDPYEHPYKVQCLVGGEWYPSNDYAAGDMTGGEFPDDGNGFHREGETYYFLREYAHKVYVHAVIPALRSLSQAYVITGDKRYARKGAVLLARLATEYPNYDDRVDRVFLADYNLRSPDNDWQGGGMITDLIWETFCLEATTYAYDALWPYLNQDPQLIEYLQSKGMPIRDGADLRRYIEAYIFRPAMSALLNGRIEGNEGHHQAAALACALVMDDYSDAHPSSIDMVDYTYHGRGHAANMLINGLTRDGGGHESPNYNRIKLDFLRVNRLMEQVRARRPQLFPLEKYPDLFAEDKPRRIFDFFLDMQIQDAFMPSIGDSGGIPKVTRSKPSAYSYLAAEYLFAFERYGDPRYARAATRPDGTLATGTLFEHYPADEIQAALALPESQIIRGPRLLDEYGTAILESGSPEHRRSLTLNYTSLIGHRQMDNLSIQLFSRGIEMLPDLGYPTGWQHRWQWDSNSLAHNTVTVDETQPAYARGGMARLFASINGVQIVSASHDPYGPAGVDIPNTKAPASWLASGAKVTDVYERTLVLVDVDEDRYYVVDCFAVNGGEQHDQSWHGPQLPIIAPSQVTWREQGGGTLAGKDVEPFSKWTDRWDRQRDDFPAYLKDIRRAIISEPVMFAWETKLPEGDVLRLHIVPVQGPLELYLGRGRSPSRPADWALEYVIARRHVKAGEATLFLAVLDAYQHAPVVQAVRVIRHQPLTLEVTRADGIDEVELHVPLTSTRTTVPRPLGVRVVSRTADKITRDVRIGQIDRSPGYVAAAITALDYSTHRIAIAVPNDAAAFAAGRTIRIHNDLRSGMYGILEARRDGDLLWLTLDSTALVARGKMTDIQDGRFTLDGYFPFSYHRIRGKDGNPTPGDPDYFAGAYLGEGENARLLTAAWQDQKTNAFYLLEKIPARTLKRMYGDRTVNIWQYNVGDKVELARVRSE